MEDLKQEVIDFLKREGILSEGCSEWVITFKDYRGEVIINGLIQKFYLEKTEKETD